jgi:ribosomal protein S18 acetylase RimI-like enzyme
MLPLIQDYVPADYEEVWALHRRTISENDRFVKNFAFHMGFQNIPTVYRYLFVMRDEGKLMGMVGLKKLSNKTMEVKRLQITKAYQGQGCGRMFMRHVLKFTKEQDVGALQLDVSAPFIKARKMYISLGFKALRTETQYLGPISRSFLSLFMEKVL